MAQRTVAVKKSAAKKPTQKKVVIVQNEMEQAYVPSPEVAKRYVNRKIWGVWDGVMAKIALEKAQNILLEGDTGSGKTLFGEAFASANKMNYYSLPCDVSIDPSSLFGRMQPTEVQGIYKWQDGPATQIFRNGGLLNISEGNFMPPKISASLYPALDGRRYIPLLGNKGEVVRAHLGTEADRPCWCDLDVDECNSKRVLIIMDQNPEYRGTQQLNAAFKNRFGFKIPWGYDEAVEAELVKFPSMREFAAKIREMRGTEVRSPLSTNALMEFEEKALNPTLGLEFAKNNFFAAFDRTDQDAVAKSFEMFETRVKEDIDAFAVAADDEDDGELVEYEFSEEDN